MTSTPQTPGLLIHAKTLLTMPDAPAALDQAFGPGPEIFARDREITGALDDAAILVEGGKIAWFGPWDKRPKRTKRDETMLHIEAGLVTPGWIDCHTHAVFAGWRAEEFVLRNAGRPYVEILEAGGGILQTVEAVRQASKEELVQGLTRAVYEFVRRGVTTLEVKSGYGLTLEDERKQLLAIAEVQKEVPCELTACFLGAHAIPKEWRSDRQGYVDLLCQEMIPQVAEQGLAVFCDVFCDRGAFDATEARRILLAGKDHGLIARIHADEITDAGGAFVAAEVGATSADHLEHTTSEGLRAMVKAGVTGVLMPAVNLYLGTLDRLAPARELLALGGEVALATDYNPGSSPIYDMGWLLTLGATLYKMTPGEVLRAVTVGAAKALGRQDIGRIRQGAVANLVLLDAPSMNAVPYLAGANLIDAVIWGGEFVYWTESEEV